MRIHGELNDPSVTKIPASEAAVLAGQLAVPIIALPARALGILWSLIGEDQDKNSPCLTDALLKPETIFDPDDEDLPIYLNKLTSHQKAFYLYRRFVSDHLPVVMDILVDEMTEEFRDRIRQ